MQNRPPCLLCCVNRNKICDSSNCTVWNKFQNPFFLPSNWNCTSKCQTIPDPELEPWHSSPCSPTLLQQRCFTLPAAHRKPWQRPTASSKALCSHTALHPAQQTELLLQELQQLHFLCVVGGEGAAGGTQSQRAEDDTKEGKLLLRPDGFLNVGHKLRRSTLSSRRQNWMLLKERTTNTKERRSLFCHKWPCQPAATSQRWAPAPTRTLSAAEKRGWELQENCCGGTGMDSLQTTKEIRL